jgi:glutamate synthase (ferredoxin)
MNEGRIMKMMKSKNAIVTKRPYRKWLNDNLLQLAKIPYTNNTTLLKTLDYETRLRLLYH